MHANERMDLILSALGATGFITYRDLETRLAASPATIRRDLGRLEAEGRITRVHGGAKLLDDAGIRPASGERKALAGTPFNESITRNLDAKKAIGRAAATLCQPGEGIMIDGGTTTL